MRTLPPSGNAPVRPSASPQQPAAQSNVQPLRQPAPPAQRQAPTAPPPARALGGGGLPPPPEDFDPNAGGGPRERRDDDYWKANPIRPGEYNFNVIVSKIKWWNLDGYTVELKVLDWDKQTNRPGEHHQRPISWQQAFSAAKLDEWQRGDAKAGKTYGFFRHKLVATYTACGWPEDQWPRDEHNAPAPPWHLFFVHTLASGIAVPVVLGARVVVERGRERWPEVQAIGVIKDSAGRPFEAPLPYEVPQAVADFHRWKVGKVRSYTVPVKTAPNGFRYDAFDVETCELARVNVGEVGLPTYKDLWP